MYDFDRANFYKSDYWDAVNDALTNKKFIDNKHRIEPFRQIIRNAGASVDAISSILTDYGYTPKNYGYNAKTGEFGDMYKMGVIDPLKVTKNALQNAVSVAVTILSTNAIITMARSYEEK